MKLLVKFLAMTLILAACSTNQEKQSSQNVKKAKTQRKFEYLPKDPINGKLMGVIEIGSLGLNYFIINIDQEDRWSLVKSEFGRSNIVFGEIDKNQAVSKIAAFQKEILNEGVIKDNLHIVASSSAIGLSNIEWLEKEINDLGMELVKVDASEEANFALTASVPFEFAQESFIVDMGSGNTKLSWTDGTDTTTLETFGSKYYLDGIQDTTVFRSVRNTMLKIPEANRNLCFMIGGMPYEFAKTEERTGRYSVLKAPTTYSDNGERMNAAIVIYSALYNETTYSYIFDWDSNFSVGYLMTIN